MSSLGYTLDGSPADHNARVVKQQFTFTIVIMYAYGQFRVTSEPNKHVFGKWEEDGVSRFEL